MSRVTVRAPAPVVARRHAMCAINGAAVMAGCTVARTRLIADGDAPPDPSCNRCGCGTFERTVMQYVSTRPVQGRPRYNHKHNHAVDGASRPLFRSLSLTVSRTVPSLHQRAKLDRRGCVCVVDRSSRLFSKKKMKY